MRILLTLIVTLCFGSGCQLRGPKSEPKIIEPDAEFRQPIVVVDQMGQDGYCVGTFIANDTVITSRQCIKPTLPGCGVMIQGQVPDTCFVDERFQENQLGPNAGIYDVALLYFKISAHSTFNWFPLGQNARLEIDRKINTKTLLNKSVIVTGFVLDERLQDSENTQAKAKAPPSKSMDSKSRRFHAKQRAPHKRACLNSIAAINTDSRSNQFGQIRFEIADSQGHPCLPTRADIGAPLIYFDPSDKVHYIVGIVSTIANPASKAVEGIVYRLDSSVITSLSAKALEWKTKSK